MHQSYFLKRILRMRLLICFTLIAMVLATCALQSTTEPEQHAVGNPVAAFEQEVEKLRKKFKIPGF